ncbi:hypothetical protein [Aliidiomarina maris]|uniref:Uncharacterized protein n=1 Tax=Aliidiomarina maris TaxID=531312 RepID=A0A327X7K2_9GAMM|nr:hypothetical protein [Aliidiomarina maris]RAK01632.1 hypothetical protein B0I24_101255 [Aliidiomarina maris]RUO28457.1 hypothetical protein CWE07_01220 [Aliidiomarina maris]
MTASTQRNTPPREGEHLVTPAAAPQLTDHSFTLQSIMEIQKSVGGLESSIKSLHDKLEKMDSNICEKVEGVSKKHSSLSDKVHVLDKKIYAATVIGSLLILAAVALMRIF